MNAQISTVSFNGQSLITFQQDGKYYAVMKPICDNIGLEWHAQRQRIHRDDVLSRTAVIITSVAEDGKNREMLCLPIEYLNGWLFGIDTKRVRPEIRETLIKYKKECYQVLHDYWSGRNATQRPILQTVDVKEYAVLHKNDFGNLIELYLLAQRQTELMADLYPAMVQLRSDLAPRIHTLATDPNLGFGFSKETVREIVGRFAYYEPEWNERLQKFNDLFPTDSSIAQNAKKRLFAR